MLNETCFKARRYISEAWRHRSGRAWRECLYSNFKVIPMRLDLARWRPGPSPPGVALAELGPGTALSEFSDPDRRDLAAHNLRLGYRGLIALRDGVAAGDAWYVPAAESRPRPHPDLERLRLDLDPGDVFFFNFYVGPDYRGQGLGKNFLAAIMTRFAAQGYARVFSLCTHRNFSSRRVHERLGFLELPHVRMVRVLFLRFLLLSNAHGPARRPCAGRER